MRYKILLIILIFLNFHNSNVVAQCVNGTETNPTAPMPNGADFKKNTFDWRMKFIPLKNKFAAGNINGELLSPFYSATNNLVPLQGGTESDSKAEDGWQLIKQDFGFAYANDSWKGQSIVGLSTNSSNQASRAYMMLYNKYSSTLRIIGILDRLNDLSQQLIVVLRLFPKNDNKTNHSQLTFNALFNRYNKQETALDLQTKTTTVRCAAQIPGTATDFFYADFNVSYDPCVCFFKSAIEVSFQVKTSSTLKLTGRILGQSVDVAQKNALPEPEYLTSVWNQDVPNQPFNQQYTSISALKKQVKNDFPSFEEVLNFGLSNLGKAAKIAKSYGTAVTTLGSSFEFLKSNAADKIGKLSSILDFISLFTGSNDKPSNPSIITAELSAIGEITSTSPVAGGDFLIGTPGSNGAKDLQEYSPSPTPQAGLAPMYPMYNESLGRFAVVRTPVVEYTNNNLTGIIGAFYFKLADNIPFSYAFNPIVDAEKTKIFVALQFKNSANALTRERDIITQFLPIQNAHNLITKLQTYGVFTPSFENINVIFEIFYQFKPDANGDVKTGMDIVKVRPKLRNQSGLAGDSRYRRIADIPSNLQIDATTFNQGRTIRSFGEITITGDLINNSSEPIIIIAQGEVIINPGVNITGNIEIKNEEVLPSDFFNDPPNPPMTAAAIETFCTSSVYKAKDQSLALKQVGPTTVNDVKGSGYKNLIFNISPNPFTEQITIDLNIEEATNANLDLSNAVGQTLKSKNLGMKEKGSYQEMIETNDLAPGIYFLTLRTQNGTETKKIVKQ